MALGKRAKIGIGVGIAVVVLVAVSIFAVVGMHDNTATASDDEGSLYIEEYGLLLNYDKTPGELNYALTKEQNGDTRIDITNESLRNTSPSCANKPSSALVGHIIATNTIGTGDDAPELYMQNGDGYLVYQFPDDSNVDTTDPCYNQDAAAKSLDQSSSLHASFNDLATAADQANADSDDSSRQE